MKTLLLLRHAKSDWSDPQLGDLNRPLNNVASEMLRAWADYCGTKTLYRI
jgi:phosphohistidine phosphatase